MTSKLRYKEGACYRTSQKSRVVSDGYVVLRREKAFQRGGKVLIVHNNEDNLTHEDRGSESIDSRLLLSIVAAPLLN